MVTFMRHNLPPEHLPCDEALRSEHKDGCRTPHDPAVGSNVHLVPGKFLRVLSVPTEQIYRIAFFLIACIPRQWLYLEVSLADGLLIHVYEYHGSIRLYEY